MAFKDKYRTKDRVHTIYKLEDGTRVPGASTIAGVLDKPALKYWANKLGMDGIDVRKYVDSLADAGTLAHYMVQCTFEGVDPDQAYLDEFSKIDHDRAETSYLKFLEWFDEHEIQTILTEAELVSEEHRFGGTCDVVALVDGSLTLVDLKTCKRLYGPGDDKWIQVAGYLILVEEQGHRIEDVRILRVGRDPSEGFEYAKMPGDPVQYKRLFWHCRQIYDLKKQVGK
jgi:hypothetical protein